MSTLLEIESAIARLPVADAEALHEWLEQWLEDQREMTPEFLATIERGKADLDAGRNRIRLFPMREDARPVTPELVRELLEGSV